MSDLHANYQQYLELQHQIKALQEKATLLMMEGRNKAINDIKSLIAVYEIRADELGYPVPAPEPKRERKPEKKRDRSIKGPPKYKDPDSDATWTGRGRVPDWLIGKNYDDFLIEKPVPSDPPVPIPAHEYAPTASPAVDASHAVHHMVSGTPSQPAAAWPDPRQPG
jgi:DNA-binding protein H-NS